MVAVSLALFYIRRNYTSRGLSAIAELLVHVS